ncbi:response regulator [Aureimonas pseudogalii]|uniref:CheY-like chemotaxis protein n=1 Tax=Aureimonas pseudogalii TaxID=1744844 RepID=A0A7W6H8B9_9HYPH|nr:response regulator [Aureimonas pseudogalii]MBB4000443.1 CheY-like chemotaxis protein [Aureimonas pseudogalii]
MSLPASRILVVEDVVENRDLLRRRLRRMQSTDTAEAADGLETLRRIRDEPFDLVLLDVMLPELYGIELLRTLRDGGRLGKMRW